MRAIPTFAGLLLATTLCTACLSQKLNESPTPVLEFLGMSTGTLTTELSKLTFRDTFTITQHELVGVASFKSIADNTKVQATWFSPDERTMPLGRTIQITQSGAKVIRFSITARTNWKPAPYTLRLDALGSKGNITTSGSTLFFIGMKEQEIQEYFKEYAEWEKEDATARQKMEGEQKQ